MRLFFLFVRVALVLLLCLFLRLLAGPQLDYAAFLRISLPCQF